MKMSSEMSLSKEICEVLRLYGIYFFHVPSEGRRTFWEQKQFKINGGMAGVSDLVIILPGETVFVELKTKTGRQSEHQATFQRMIEFHKQRYLIWRSIDDAVDFVGKERDKKIISSR